MSELNKAFKLCDYTYKYLCSPLEDCCWCRGEGHEWQDCEELSGYDYRDVCRCMKRDKRFKQFKKLGKERA